MQTVNEIGKCCENQKWYYVADASHADGCEFTYGKCRNCSANLIHLYVAAIGGAKDFFRVVPQEFVNEMVKLKGKALKNFMREWYNSL